MTLDTVRTGIGRRFARVATNTVVRRPGLWQLFRGPIRKQFDSLAPKWEQMRGSEALASYRAALDALPSAPRRALDLGTGTGAGAFLIAHRFPDVEVVGADLSPRMIEQALRMTPADLRVRVRFDVADATRLPYDAGFFDLVGLANMIPFFDELARVVAPGGHVVFCFSAGADTPIFVPFDRLRSELGRRGFTDFADFKVGTGTSLLARKAERS
jgi:SAM-dependent methyltransferase